MVPRPLALDRLASIAGFGYGLAYLLRRLGRCGRGHTQLPQGHEEVRRFAFELHDGSESLPVRESVPLRTARVVVKHLRDGNALIQMFRAIVNREPAEYDNSVGQSFEDDFIENDPSDRVDNSPGWQNADR